MRRRRSGGRRATAAAAAGAAAAAACPRAGRSSWSAASQPAGAAEGAPRAAPRAVLPPRATGALACLGARSIARGQARAARALARQGSDQAVLSRAAALYGPHRAPGLLARAAAMERRGAANFCPAPGVAVSPLASLLLCHPLLLQEHDHQCDRVWRGRRRGFWRGPVILCAAGAAAPGVGQFQRGRLRLDQS